MRVSACAVCRTDLHVVDGELPSPKLPLVPGHEIVGVIDALGPGTERAAALGGTPLALGQRVGIPWLGGTCGVCRYCTRGQENLCDRAVFTGYQRDGGYADHAIADHRFALPLPDTFDDLHAAPLLCAGLIGHRSLVMAGDAERVGLYGFGAAAHIVAQLARAEGRTVFAFTRPGDEEAQRFARELGCVWAGAAGDAPPEELDAAILFAPVGALVPEALRVTRRGGTVVCGGIHMSDIPQFPYSLLWGERVVRSVANLTRRDGLDFFAKLRTISIHTEVQPRPLVDANRALRDLREGRARGALVLTP